MSIDAKFEIAKHAYLPSPDNWYYSKPFANFAITVESYCDFRTNTEEATDENSKQIAAWFASIAAKMTRDICLLSRGWSDDWEYDAGDYEAYLHDEQKFQSGPVMTPEVFAMNCAEAMAAWVDLNEMRKMVGDLAAAVDKVRPPDTWWYKEAYSLPALWQAYRALLSGLNQGYQRVRIVYG